MATTTMTSERLKMFINNFGLPFAQLGLSKAKARFLRLVVITLATMLFYRRMQSSKAKKQDKSVNDLFAKDLSSAPSLNKYIFFWTKKTISEVLINEFERFKSSGDRLGCIWFGSKKVVVATHPQTAKEILKDLEVYKKGEIMNFLDSPLKAFYTNKDGKKLPDLVMSNDEEWSAQRKHFNAAFKPIALENVLPKFAELADIFVKHGGENKEIQVVSATAHFALDCLGVGLLGRSFNAQKGKFEGFYESYLIVVDSMGSPLFNLFPSLFDLPLERNRKLKTAVNTVKDFLLDSYEERSNYKKLGKLDADDTCLVDAMIKACEDPAFPKDCILPNLWTFFVAGHDTTATSLAWILNAFAQFPDVQQKAFEELKSIFGENCDKPTLSQLEQLKYLNAVIKENLRMNPPVHNLATREAVQDTTLDGFFVPKGTMVSIAIHAVNMHKDGWKEPEKFNPDRFLDPKRTVTNEQSRRERRADSHDMFSWLPFSYGSRRCIGNRFSVLEQKVLLAKLLLAYEIVPEIGEPCGNLDLPLSSGSFAFVFKQPKPFSVKVKARGK